ncbi:hypothetical protein FACS189425_03920 [Clostridia bacterium]|nr:hypothetical protein FACS189425_03920 [Clostridia bacterium]
MKKSNSLKWVHWPLALSLLVTILPVYAAGSNIVITLDKKTVKIGEVFTATVSLQGISAYTITAPLHFNPSVVKLVNTDGEIVVSGLKTPEELRDGSAGTITGAALGTDVSAWNGAIFTNTNYPILDNELGFCRLLFTNAKLKAINEDLISFKFIAVGEGDADIRFATDDDSAYDKQSPEGASYVNEQSGLVFLTCTPPTFKVSGDSGVDIVVAPPSSGGGGGGGGGGSAYKPTVDLNTDKTADASGKITVEITPEQIENYISRAADETNNSLNIDLSKTGQASGYVVKVPISSVKNEIDALVLTTLIETPIGIIGFDNQEALKKASKTAKNIVVSISTASSDSFTINISADDAALINCGIIGIKSTNMAAVAYFNGNPIIKSKFDGKYLIFNALGNGDYTVSLSPLDFADVNASSWSAPYIQSLVAKGILNGITPTTFEPNANITREQFAKMLVTAMGLSDDSATANFKDVSPNDWFYSSVASSVKAGLISGYEDNTFGTNKNITRQEMAVMISRCKVSFPAYEASIAFGDNASIADWAKPAVRSMQQAKIISGLEDGTFAPTANATREQAAKIIYGVLGL